ncbi:hypothetical protein OC845_000067 [Tilletia horrida]|nr:hypothetical protein OC845_000067 [Tilletia horrida]
MEQLQEFVKGDSAADGEQKVSSSSFDPKSSWKHYHHWLDVNSTTSFSATLKEPSSTDQNQLVEPWNPSVPTSEICRAPMSETRDPDASVSQLGASVISSAAHEVAATSPRPGSVTSSFGNAPSVTFGVLWDQPLPSSSAAPVASTSAQGPALVITKEVGNNYNVIETMRLPGSWPERGAPLPPPEGLTTLNTPEKTPTSSTSSSDGLMQQHNYVKLGENTDRSPSPTSFLGPLGGSGGNTTEPFSTPRPSKDSASSQPFFKPWQNQLGSGIHPEAAPYVQKGLLSPTHDHVVAFQIPNGHTPRDRHRGRLPGARADPNRISGSTFTSFLNLKLPVPSKGPEGAETPHFAAAVGPFTFGTDLYDGPEDDDDIHGASWDAFNASDVTSRKGRSSSKKRRVELDRRFHFISDWRGCLNVCTLLFLAVALVFVFAGWPILTAFLPKSSFNPDGSLTREAAAKIGYGQATVRLPAYGTNASKLGWNMMRTGLIDPDTPADAMYRTGTDGRGLRLVFSDEFNVENRTFFPGDDPIWLGQDLFYWGTGDYEYYHPSAITTREGHLRIRLSERPMNGKNYTGGMLNAWNAFCFTGGRVEVSIRLPGSPDVSGLWPAAWMMGNLGRAGYGASTDGMWPYSYDTCDVGTLANQTYGPNGTGGPVAAETTGVYVDQYGPGLSYLPGQRLSRCTCSDSTDHPGPRHSDGTWKARSAPELDIFEASAEDGGSGWNSMSLQLAPYDSGYNLTRLQYTTVWHPERGDKLNPYTGSPYQQAVSALIKTNQRAYERSGKEFAVYGVEYQAASELQDDGYITWLSDGDKAWTLHGPALGPNPLTEIGQRIIPQEPLYPIINLGMSASFTWVDWEKLHFPTEMLVDYIRIWQPEDAINIGCDGLDDSMPTSPYLAKHAEIYRNANLTTFREPRERAGYGKRFPGNALKGECM